MNTCRFCNRDFKPKPQPPMPDGFHDLIHSQVFAVGTCLAADVCEDKGCQRALQHECDEYDAYRKGE